MKLRHQLAVFGEPFAVDVNIEHSRGARLSLEQSDPANVLVLQRTSTLA